MGRRERTPRAPRRTVAAGLVAFTALYALTALLMIDPTSADSDDSHPGLTIGDVEIVATGAALIVRGRVPSASAADDVIDVVVTRSGAPVVFDRLVIDTGVASPDLAALGSAAARIVGRERP